MITLDDAIKHCNEVVNSTDNCKCAEDHKQLANWLMELKALRAEKVGGSE